MYIYETFKQKSLPPAVLVLTDLTSDPVAAYIAPRITSAKSKLHGVLIALYIVLATFTILTSTNFFLMLGLLVLIGFSYLTLSDVINTKPTTPVEKQQTINALQKKFPSIRILNTEKDLFKEFPPYVNP